MIIFYLQQRQLTYLKLVHTYMPQQSVYFNLSLQNFNKQLYKKSVIKHCDL